MKKMLVAATTVGAAIAGLTLYLQKRSRGKERQKLNHNEGTPSAGQMAIERGTHVMG